MLGTIQRLRERNNPRSVSRKYPAKQKFIMPSYEFYNNLITNKNL